MKWIAAILLSATVALAAVAEDWPQWRGAGRDGVWAERGVVEAFPAAGLTVRWRAAVGFGFSSPVVARGLVLVADARLDRPKVRDRVLCFDEASGKLRWSYSHAEDYPDWAFVAGQEPGPNATPAVSDGKVYALGPMGHRVVCLAAESGAMAWEKDLKKEYGLEATASVSASPLVDGDRLILLIGGKPGACVVALDKKSGKEVWRALGEQAAHSSPVIVTAGGARQLIVWTLQSVTSLDPESGKVYWRERYVSPSSSVVATPVFSDGRLLVGGVMFKLDGERPGASVLWPKERARGVLSSTSTALVRSGHVFSASTSGRLVCLDAGTGEPVWESDKATDAKGGTSSSIHLTANGNSVLMFNDRGMLIRARLGGGGYEEVGRVPLIEPSYAFGGRKVVWAPPAFANGHVLVRNDRELIRTSVEARP